MFLMHTIDILRTLQRVRRHIVRQPSLQHR